MLRLTQLLAGRDFALGDGPAAQMVNFVYEIADETTRRSVLVDPAWDIEGLVGLVERRGNTLAGALATHYHPDHVGGDLWGLTVEGLARLIAIRPVPVHVHADEARGVGIVTGLSSSDLVPHAGGDSLELGSVR